MRIEPVAEPRCKGDTLATTSAFTIIELLTVMSIIIVLAGLILATSGYVQKKGARARAEAEIAAMSAALENYKADNGVYPSNSDTMTLNAVTDGNPVDPTKNPSGGNYSLSSLYLYGQLSGDYDNGNANAATNYDRKLDGNETGKAYFSFKPNQLSPADQTQKVTSIRDPFGNSYGYSTAKGANPGGAAGYNPTFDLWSTAGETAKKSGETFQQYQQRWIKNW